MPQRPTPLVIALTLAGGLATAACARDPRDGPCPAVAVGDLVLSELRGAQPTGDTLGQWIEIYNATDHAVDLTGLVVAMRKLDGSGAVQIVVRATDAQVAARGYAVLGKFPAGGEPSYVDYGYAADFSASLYSAGAIQLEACGTTVDQFVYNSLPGTGTLAFDGTNTPTAAANDVESAWCVDTSGSGAPGTPQQRNHPCSH